MDLDRLTKDELNVFDDNISYFLNKPIDSTGLFQRPIESFEEYEPDSDRHRISSYINTEIRELSLYFKNIHRWFAANPNRQSTIDRGNRLFKYSLSSSRFYSSLKEENIANDIINKEALDLEDDSFKITNIRYQIERILRRKDVVICFGNKGVGKTTFINFWLNNYSQYLEEEDRLVWFRIDASKYYDIRKKLLGCANSNVELNVFNYHAIHTVYVVLKYGRRDSCRSKAIKKVYQSVWLASKKRNNIKLESAIKNVDEALRYIPDDFLGNTSAFLEECCDPKKNELFESCLEIYKHIDKGLKENHYNVLFIIDGVDNISGENVGTTEYRRLCQEISGLFLTINTPRWAYGYKILIVIRPETWADIRSTSVPNYNVIRFADIETCFIAPTCPNDILLHKADVAMNPMCEDLESVYSKTKKGIEQYCSYENEETRKIILLNVKRGERVFQEFSNGYLDKLRKAIFSRYFEFEQAVEKDESLVNINHFKSSDYRKKEDLLHILYNDNTRAFVDNFLENYQTFLLAVDKRIIGARDIDRTPQYLLLNGRLYLDTGDVGHTTRGEGYPNIFWWNDKIDPANRNWHGLVLIRLLQLLKYVGKSSRENIIQLLGKLFGYHNKIVNESFDILLKHGLISLKRVKHGRLYRNDFDKALNLYELTGKGYFILDFIFMYPFWLYFCSIDTPLENSIVMQDSRLIRFHRNIQDYSFIETFNEAFCMTTITFARKILTQHAKEMRNIGLALDINDIAILDPTESISKEGLISEMNMFFSIPDTLNYFVKRDVFQSINNLNKSRKSKQLARHLYNDIFGIYGYS